MATARDLINNSLRLIGAIATGETPSADEANDGLIALNNLVDSWSNEKLLIYNIVREEFSLTGGQQAYTIGATGNFATSRPLKIESASLEVQGSDPYECPINIVDYDEWSRIASKEVTSSIPHTMYIEGTFPNETINLWPVPSEANKVVLYSRKPLTNFTINTEIVLPPGYMRALVYNLALEIAPEYGKEPLSSVVNSAMEAKENIKRTNNTRTYLMSFDSALVPRNGFDYETGE